MQADFQGRLRNTTLPERHALLPLYEALVNSIDSIDQEPNETGSVSITLRRELSGWDEAESAALPEIIAVTIEDDGRGFTNENMEAFETLDTTAKASRGGKGIGRISWLKAFERVRITSTFPENGGWYHRAFDFVPTRLGIENKTTTRVEPPPFERATTRVELLDFREKYRSAAPKSAEHVARRIIDHALELFVLGLKPDVTLHDPDLDTHIDLRELFRRAYDPNANIRQFRVGNHSFNILDVLLRPDGDVRHHLSFCANRRVALTLPLSGRIPHLDTTINGPDGALIYAGYITGELLEKSVVPDRTGFNIEHRGELTRRLLGKT